MRDSGLKSYGIQCLKEFLKLQKDCIRYPSTYSSLPYLKALSEDADIEMDTLKSIVARRDKLSKYIQSITRPDDYRLKNLSRFVQKLGRMQTKQTLLTESYAPVIPCLTSIIRVTNSPVKSKLRDQVFELFGKELSYGVEKSY